MYFVVVLLCRSNNMGFCNAKVPGRNIDETVLLLILREISKYVYFVVSGQRYNCETYVNDTDYLPQIMSKRTGALKVKYLFQDIDVPKTCYEITYNYIPFRNMSTISGLSKLHKRLNFF